MKLSLVRLIATFATTENFPTDAGWNGFSGDLLEFGTKRRYGDVLAVSRWACPALRSMETVEHFTTRSELRG